MNTKVFQSFALAILALFFVGGSASACPGYYLTTTNYDTQVTATGVIDNPDPGGGLRITINLQNPGNSSSAFQDSGENFYNYSVAVDVFLDKGNLDGTYVATTQNYSYAWPGAAARFLGQAQSNKVVDPWIQIVRTGVASSTMAKTSGTNSFSTYLATSTNCAGNFSVYSVLAYPSGMQAQIQDGSLNWGPSATKSVTMSGANTLTISYSIRTLSGNTVSGTLTSSASLSSAPSSCTIRDPDAGSGYSKTSTITVSP